jgi:hypothetical protein
LWNHPQGGKTMLATTMKMLAASALAVAAAAFAGIIAI